jgi:hypothetical protein
MAARSAILYCEIGGMGGIRYFTEPGGRGIKRQSVENAIRDGWLIPVSPGLFGDSAPQAYIANYVRVIDYDTEKERENEARSERKVAAGAA